LCILRKNHPTRNRQISPMTNKISWSRIRPFLWISLAAAGALLRFEYLREFSHSPLFGVAVGPDVSEYHAWAQRILSGWLLPQELPIHAPLYPFFLSGVEAIFGISPIPVRIVQVWLNFGAWLLLYALLKHQVEEHLPRCQAVPELFLALVMLTPVPIYYQAELVCESLILPLSSLLLFFRTRLYEGEGKKLVLFSVLYGAIGGLAAITHPMTLGATGLMLLADAVSLRKTKESIRLWLSTVLAFLLPIVAVSAIHSSIAKRAVLIQGNGVFNLYLGHSPEANGTCWLRPGKQWNEKLVQLQQEAKLRNCSRDALLWKKIGEFYREHPDMLLRLFCRKAVLVFSPRELISGADPEPVIFATRAMQCGKLFGIVLLPLALLGGVRLCRFRSDAAVFLPWLCWGAGLLLMQCLTVTSERYRTAMFPCFALLAAYAAAELTVSLRKREWKPMLALAGLIVLFGFYYCHTAPGKQAEIETHVLYAEAALAQKNPQEAMRHYLAVRTLSGDETLYAVPVGRAKELAGDTDGAFEEYQKGAESGDIDGIVNCGVICLQRREIDRAERFLRYAVAHPGANASAYYNYGVYLWDFTPRKREGIAAIARALELNPGHVEAWNQLGAIAFTEHRYADAEHYFEQAVALRPENKIYWRNLMAAAGASGDIPRAKAVKEKLRRMEQENGN